MRTKLFMIAGIALLAATVPALAHHAFTAEFDSNQPIKFRGAVAKIELINPHSWFHVDVKEPDGKTTRWMVEGGTPNRSEEHTSELQSQSNLVCRLLLEKKKQHASHRID